MLLEERDTSLGEQKNESSLKSFSIYGLFGYKNITIPFDKKALVILSENGAGKTTLLNIIYYSVLGKFDKLSDFDFERIIFEFQSGKVSELNKNELEKNEAIELFRRLDSSSWFSKRTPRSSYLLEMALRETMALLKQQENDSITEEDNSIKNHIFQSKQKPEQPNTLIETNIDDFVFYFPTYRRIEEDIRNLGNTLENKDFDASLIQFGMEDVQEIFNKIKLEITSFALELYSKLTGDTLTQIIENNTVTQNMRDKINPDILGIILSRVGEQNISREKQEQIKHLIRSGEIHESNKYDQLVYFLSKLIDLYEPQRVKDESIKKFVCICNKYFEYFNYPDRKKLVYDETSADIYMLHITRNQKIDLKNLSSGEKQILSLFTKVYLESEDDFIFIIDEPELSLSLEWQRLLLPDILRSGKCKLLIAATHSPFIFDNELDNCVHDLDTFTTLQ